jgi:putative endonuclease
MHFVYILVSENSPGKIYIGVTVDLEKRLDRHNTFQSSYSKHYALWRLESYVAFSNQKQAHAFERYLKQGSGFAFLKKHLI